MSPFGRIFSFSASSAAFFSASSYRNEIISKFTNFFHFNKYNFKLIDNKIVAKHILCRIGQLHGTFSIEKKTFEKIFEKQIFKKQIFDKKFFEIDGRVQNLLSSTSIFLIWKRNMSTCLAGWRLDIVVQSRAAKS